MNRGNEMDSTGNEKTGEKYMPKAHHVADRTVATVKDETDTGDGLNVHSGKKSCNIETSHVSLKNLESTTDKHLVHEGKATKTVPIEHKLGDDTGAKTSIVDGDCVSSEEPKPRSALHTNTYVGPQSGNDPLRDTRGHIQVVAGLNSSDTKGGEGIPSKTSNIQSKEGKMQMGNTYFSPLIIPNGNSGGNVPVLQQSSLKGKISIPAAQMANETKSQAEKTENRTANTVFMPNIKLDVDSKNDKRKKPQVISPLVAMYGPFVRIDESTLVEARQRLKVALEQTRILREAFSSRVYDKYRVVLRPVQRKIEEIVEPIRKEPSVHYKRIIHERENINREKKLEATDIQKSNSELESGDANALVAGERCGTEHIEWFTSGLNLVILPEEDTNEAELRERGISHRGPLDPQTGGRVKEISAAAASAASHLLDRVRKGSEITLNRKRKFLPDSQQCGPIESDISRSVPHNHTMQQASQPYNVQSSLTSMSGKDQRKGSMLSYNAGMSRLSKTKLHTSLASQLSLDPNIEGVKLNGKMSAATHALIRSDLSSSMVMKNGKLALNQQRFLHPFPLSKGARSVSLGQNHSLSHQSRGSPKLALPPVPTQLERKTQVLKSHPNLLKEPRNEGATSVMRNILRQFIDDSEVEAVGKDDIRHSSKRRRLKRRVTEIEFLGNLQKHSKTNSSDVDTNHKKKNIDPHLAFSVLYSLRTITNASISPKWESHTMGDLLSDIGNIDATNDVETTKDESDFLQQMKRRPDVKLTDATLSEKICPPESSDLQTDKDLSGLNKTREGAKSERTYIAELRGGGGEIDSKFGKEERNDERKSAMSTPSSAQSTMHGNTSYLGQSSPQRHLHSRRQENEMLQAAVLWNGQQSRNELAALRSQASVPSILPQHMQPNLDGAYALMAQAGIRTDSVAPGLFAQTNQSHNTGVSAALSGGNLQGQQHHQGLVHSIGGGQVDQQYHLSNSSVQNRQLQMAQNSLQRATAAIHSAPMMHHSGSDISDYFSTGGIHRSQTPTGYNSPPHTSDWATLAAAHGLIPTQPSMDQSSIGLASHQAMINLSVRERARVILAREQQQQLQAEVAAAQRNNASIARGAISSYLSGSPNNRPSTASSYNSQNPSIDLTFNASLQVPLKSEELQIKAKESLDRVGHKLPQSKDSDYLKRSDTVSGKRPSSAGSRPSSQGSKTHRPASAGSRSSSNSKARNKKRQLQKPSQPSSPVQMSQSQEATPRTNVNGNPGKMPGGVDSNISVNDKGGKISSKLRAKNGESRNGNRENTMYNENKTEKTKGSTERRNVESIRQHRVLVSAVDSSNGKGTGLLKSNGTLKSLKTEDNLNEASESMLSSTGLKFFVPPHSEKISNEESKNILKGQLYLVNDTASVEKQKSLLDYLLAVGDAVPVPNALVANPLKDRLNSSPYKQVIASLASHLGSTVAPRDVISSVISIWLWASHRGSFEKAFERHGRIDVDHHCKWLINAAVEKGTRPLLSRSFSSLSNNTGERNVVGNLAIATVVSRALMEGLAFNNKMDVILPNLGYLTDHLDDLHDFALHLQCKERTLLATLISRRQRMHEAFSHSYTSSMVRSGEALGHDELACIVQDNSTKTSSLLPSDILSDSTGAWEDPCRPLLGFTPGLSGDELNKRAHARAIIRKSLKKLQDRHGIKGGAPDAGVYMEPPTGADGKAVAAHYARMTPSPPKASPRSSGSKRKASFVEASSIPNVALFNPNHYSSPFVWDTNEVENMPYGRSSEYFGNSFIKSVMSGGKFVAKKARVDVSKDLPLNQDTSTTFVRSTQEIDWTNAADMFEDVVPVEKTKGGTSHDAHGHSAPVVVGSTIIAPFCRKKALSEIESDSDSDIEGLERTDEMILESHQNVLIKIKEKFDTMMSMRSQSQERSRQRSGR